MNQAAPLIAIVDDEESVRRALQRLLRSAGMAVETFASGADFLASLETHEPSAIVLDLHMPAPNGFDVQAELGRTHANVAVVVITGHDTPESRQRALAGGAVAYFRKPVDGEQLIEALNQAIEKNP